VLNAVLLVATILVLLLWGAKWLDTYQELRHASLMHGR
jgi:hypothetical protein